MSILDFATRHLGMSLTNHQRELLTQLEVHKGHIYFHKPRTHGMKVVDEIYKKYNEVILT